ncbi:hypothetical protein EBR21_06430 [bacterium]|nr:hypothetical protein [bacterium]
MTVNTRSNLHEVRSLFEAQLPDQLKQGLCVVGCTQKKWRVSIPGSKSVTNRAIVLAMLSGKPLKLEAPLLADDTWWGFLALDQLGFDLDLRGMPQAIGIHPPRPAKKKSTNDPQSVLIHVGQAGTLGRFLLAALLNWHKVYPDSLLRSFVVTADAQLARRPLAPVISALRELGAGFEVAEGKSFPLSVSVSALRGRCTVDSSTSGQFLSGVLLAAAGSRNQCRIGRSKTLVQPDYVRMTLQMLADFGARVDVDSSFEHFTVQEGEWHPPSSYRVEADASTACYYAALACVLGVDLEVENLGSGTVQPDFEFISILRQFGFEVEVQQQAFRVWGSRGRANTTSVLKLDLSRCSDQALTVGVMGIVTSVSVEVHGVAHSFCSNCRALGIAVDELQDGFRVRSSVSASALTGDWPTHNDHRFALSGIVLSAWASKVRVQNPACMQKTAPAFVAQLQSLGVLFGS